MATNPEQDNIEWREPRVRFIRYNGEHLRIERRAKDDWQVNIVGKPWKATWASTLRTAVLSMVGEESCRFTIKGWVDVAR
jgi:hypothetical protein